MGIAIWKNLSRQIVLMREGASFLIPVLKNIQETRKAENRQDILSYRKSSATTALTFFNNVPCV
jgi:hypothetical protein